MSRNTHSEWDWLVISNIMNNNFVPITDDPTEEGVSLTDDFADPEKVAVKKDLFSKLSEEAWQVMNILYTAPDELMSAFGFTRKAWKKLFTHFPVHKRERIEKEIYQYLKEVTAL